MIVSTPEAVAIYEAYPRKVKKPSALRAILKAISEHGFEKLLARTREYAERAQAKDLQFIPYPATFFNQQMFDDDYDAIFPASNGNGHPASDTPLWARIKAIEALIAENTKQRRAIQLPNPLQYENPNGPRYLKDFGEARSKRDKLKTEGDELQKKLGELQRQSAYSA